MLQSALYIHIPFCEKLCPYCAFYKIEDRYKNEDAFINAIDTEAKTYKNRLGTININSLFLGGGTPSTLSNNGLKKLLESLHTHFNITPNCEKTSEANPDSLRPSFLQTLKEYDFNRISMGVQSFNPDEQEFLGRTHKNQDVASAIKQIKDAGFKNFNLDLIFGLPISTLKKLENSLKQCIAAEASHISAYALSIEDGTPFAKNHIKGLDPDHEIEHYMFLENFLKDHGYQQYEISAFAKKGAQCHHNLAYWQLNNYIGLGPSAASFFENHSYKNISNLDKYLQNPTQNIPQSLPQKSPITPEIEFDFICTQLRLNQGLSKHQFKDRFQKEFTQTYHSTLEALITENYIKNTQTHITCTSKGRYVLNEILLKLMPTELTT